MVLVKTFESPLDCKEIKPVHSNGNQSEYSLDELMLTAEAPILWPPELECQLIQKDSDAGKD